MAEIYKVLFISAPVGAGHIKAAQSIAEAMRRQHSHVKIKQANVFDFFNQFAGKSILNGYLKILELFPKVYGMAYALGNESSLALLGRQLINSYLAKKMEQYILEYNPDSIVCTHATPAGMVSSLVKKKKLSVPVIGVITDFVVHRLWIYPEISHYIVANEEMKDFLQANGTNPKRIKMLGIPVEEKFLQKICTSNVLHDLQFSKERKTILIMGGGAGLLPMEEIIQSCEKSSMLLQIIIVTGKNKNMYNKLMTLQPALHNKVRVLGYVDCIQELMAVSDLIISKPGGVTSAESLCLGLPMLIYRPIPGQEEANTDYLVKNGAAVRANSLSEMQQLIERLFVKEPEMLIRMRQCTLKIEKKCAAPNISNFIYSQMERK